MSFPQKNILQDMAVGVPGDKATLNPAVYTPLNYIVADQDVITAGHFCFGKTESDGPSYPLAHSSIDHIDATMILGFVQRNLSYASYCDGGMNIAAGEPLNIAICGDFYVIADTEITMNATVYTSMEDGSVSFVGDASGTAEKDKKYMDTGWKARIPYAQAGDLVVISKW